MKWPRPKKRKIGNKLAEILEPIVEIIDEKLGTNLKECEGCKKRKELLNKLSE